MFIFFIFNSSLSLCYNVVVEAFKIFPTNISDNNIKFFFHNFSFLLIIIIFFKKLLKLNKL